MTLSTQLAKPRILLTGTTGQVGQALCATLAPHGEVVSTASPARAAGAVMALDLADHDALVRLIRAVRPQIIVNPAAYTAVDKAESEPELARRVNAEAPGIMAEEARRLGAALVHFSTDYVFDGSGTTARDEAAPTGPLNVYGLTKLAGEQAITAVGGAYVILRTSWIFSEHGANFVKTMLRLGAEHDSLRVVVDQVGAPTSAAFLAQMTASLVAGGAGLAEKSGIYHLCCAGETSWQGFATAIFAQARAAGWPLKVGVVEPIASEAYPTPARRPKNSRLDCAKFFRTFGGSQQPWTAALADVLRAWPRT